MRAWALEKGSGSVINDLGFITLVLSGLVSLYALYAALRGRNDLSGPWLDSARRAAIVVFPLLSLSVAAVIYGLLSGDFQVDYVYQTSSRAMSTFLKVTALWGGQDGSILFWTWLMSAFALAMMIRKWDADRPLMPWVIVVTIGTLLFFQGVSLFIANPFERLWFVGEEVVQSVWQPAGAFPAVPRDGQGLNPLLRHPGMIGHPPTLYLGFVGFVIPYAFAMAALITGRAADDAWIRATRRWTLVAWLFLAIGLILGGRWAYDVLGWGGYWGWDPVENASFMPWLTGTAFLHSVMIQEKRGMLKVWNMILIILTYSLVLFGTFITRSGVISSVHSFAQSAIGPAFFAFISVTFLASLFVLFERLGTLKSEHEMDSLLSREAVFLLQNLLFLGITFATFWGTIFPMISELVTGEKITVGPPFYNKVNGPLFAALVLIMGVAPLLAWRRGSAARLGRALRLPFALAAALILILVLFGVRKPGALFGYWLVAFVGMATLWEFARGVRARMHHGEGPALALIRLVARNRRRYGGYAVHLGVVMMALGVVGTQFFQQETQGMLRRGESLHLGGYTLTYESLRRYALEGGDRQVTEAEVSLYRDGRFLRALRPHKDFFLSSGQPLSIPAVLSKPGEDVYVLLVAWDEVGAEGATFKIYLNPLVNWIWWGALALIAGTLLAAWPGRPAAVSWATHRRPAMEAAAR
jgi:cytochrome c-type biogenesis protein CcmF